MWNIRSRKSSKKTEQLEEMFQNEDVLAGISCVSGKRYTVTKPQVVGIQTSRKSYIDLGRPNLFSFEILY